MKEGKRLKIFLANFNNKELQITQIESYSKNLFNIYLSFLIFPIFFFKFFQKLF